MKQEDVNYMRLALQEANKGSGRTSPNPCVGAIIVRDNVIVGKGYHRKAGTPHAEVNAIEDAGSNIVGATIYVTLEPCNHTGRTPPCTKAIIDAGLSRVVVGMTDPNPSVIGGGCAYLLSQGLIIESGVLDDECRAINRPFIKHSATGLPWVVMKAGMSLDGKITYVPGKGGRINGDKSKRVTHELRNSLDALLIGVDTAIIDDPSLTTRFSDTTDKRDPVRIILDTHLRLSPDARLLRQQSDAQTWIYCGPEANSDLKDRLIEAGASVFPVNVSSEGRLDIRTVFSHLGANGITSVLVEGGASIHGSMFANDLVDEVYLFTAPVFIGDKGTALLSGYSALSSDKCPRIETIDCRMLGDDILLHGYIKHCESR